MSPDESTRHRHLSGSGKADPPPEPAREELSLLLVDDEDTLREAMATVLREEGYRVEAVATAEEARSRIDAAEWDLIVSDLRLPDGDGIDVLAHARDVRPDAMLLVITAHASVSSVVEALRLGAVDYVIKPVEFDELLAKVARIAAHRRLRRENIWLRRALALQTPVEGFVGESRAAAEVRRLVALYGLTDRPVLVTGESGTGKELVARALHEASPFRDGPFVPVNCAALPPSLLESELFGHEKGAFTGAERRHQGFFEVAEEGTLFLDEIAEMAIELQAKLLRVVETREVQPVGSERTIRVRTRLVAATNRDLGVLVEGGRFRRDLFYRLNVLRIDVAPLRERREDVPLLARHFVQKHRTGLGSAVTDLDAAALDLLERHDWPGNVRELENVIQRALLTAATDRLGPGDLAGVLPGMGAEASPRTLREAVREYEREFIRRALRRTRGNKAEAAAQLGISLATLYAKLKEEAAPARSQG